MPGIFMPMSLPVVPPENSEQPKGRSTICGRHSREKNEQKEHAEAILQSKKSETRARRVQKILEKLTGT
jgi:hypothetical protein